MLIARASWTATSAPGPASASDAIVLVAAVAGLALTLWLGLGLVLAVLAFLPGGAGHLAEWLAVRLAPFAVRRAVAFLLGTTLTAALAPGTAAAQPSWTGDRGSHGDARPLAAAPQHVALAVTAVPDPSFDALLRRPTAVSVGPPVGSGPTPSAPASSAAASSAAVRTGAAGPAPAAPDPAWTPLPPKRTRQMREAPVDLVSRLPARGRAADEQIVVRRGDTLWDIAARHLGPRASLEEVAREWPRWHAANASVIGPDPDLIQPGQRLSAPTLERVTK